MGLNMLSIVRRFIYRASHGLRETSQHSRRSLSVTFKYCSHTSVSCVLGSKWKEGERSQRTPRVRWEQWRCKHAPASHSTGLWGTSRHSQVSPVSVMWPWAQVCTLAMHKEQRYQKHTEYLIVGVFLLRKPSLAQTNLNRSHHYTNNMPRGMFLSD